MRLVFFGTLPGTTLQRANTALRPQHGQKLLGNEKQGDIRLERFRYIVPGDVSMCPGHPDVLYFFRFCMAENTLGPNTEANYAWNMFSERCAGTTFRRTLCPNDVPTCPIVLFSDSASRNGLGP